MGKANEIWEGSGTELGAPKSAFSAAAQAGATKNACPVDEIAAALIDDKTGIPSKDVAVLYGYLWRSPNDDRVHLYLTWFVDEYIDLTKVAILYWRKIPYDGGTLVWVPRDTTLRHVRVRPPEEQAHRTFLSGRIAETYLSGAPAEITSFGAADAAFAPETGTCWTKPCG